MHFLTVCCIDILHVPYVNNELLSGLGAPHAPYSKSHNRRVKRKAREQLSTGMTELVSALESVVDDEPLQTLVGNPTEDGVGEEKERLKPARTGIIAEGKANPLSKHQRKQVL